MKTIIKLGLASVIATSALNAADIKGCKNRSYSDTKTENIRTPYRSTLGQ